MKQQIATIAMLAGLALPAAAEDKPVKTKPTARPPCAPAVGKGFLETIQMAGCCPDDELPTTINFTITFPEYWFYGATSGGFSGIDQLPTTKVEGCPVSYSGTATISPGIFAGGPPVWRSELIVLCAVSLCGFRGDTGHSRSDVTFHLLFANFGWPVIGVVATGHE